MYTYIIYIYICIHIYIYTERERGRCNCLYAMLCHAKFWTRAPPPMATGGQVPATTRAN